MEGKDMERQWLKDRVTLQKIEPSLNSQALGPLGILGVPCWLVATWFFRLLWPSTTRAACSGLVSAGCQGTFCHKCLSFVDNANTQLFDSFDRLPIALRRWLIISELCGSEERVQRGTNCIADLVRSVPGGLDAVDTFMILYVCWLGVKHCRKPNSPFPSVCNSKWFKHVQTIPRHHTGYTSA